MTVSPYETQSIPSAWVCQVKHRLINSHNIHYATNDNWDRSQGVLPSRSQPVLSPLQPASAVGRDLGMRMDPGDPMLGPELVAGLRHVFRLVERAEEKVQRGRTVAAPRERRAAVAAELPGREIGNTDRAGPPLKQLEPIERICGKDHHGAAGLAPALRAVANRDVTWLAGGAEADRAAEASTKMLLSSCHLFGSRFQRRSRAPHAGGSIRWST